MVVGVGLACILVNLLCCVFLGLPADPFTEKKKEWLGKSCLNPSSCNQFLFAILPKILELVICFVKKSP